MSQPLRGSGLRRSDRRAARRAAALGLATAAAVSAATFGAVSGSGAAPAAGFANGRGSAIAQSYKVNPTAASLSLGITFGISLADYANQSSRAESRAIDLGIIGTILGGEGCDGGDPTLPRDQQPQPLRAESSDPKAATGYSETEPTAPFITKSVRASSTPDAHAETTTIPLGQAGVLTISGARSSATSRVLDGRIREARAIADVSGIEVAGVIKLANLHWEAVHHSGGDGTVSGLFRVGNASVAGVPIPNLADTDVVFATLNTALAPLGVNLRPPRSHVEHGILFVDPLSIAVVPSATRDQVAGTVLGGAQPVRQALVDAILAQSCKNATYVTVADIVVGSITGSGSFSVDLGGVQATTSELKTTSALGALGGGLGELPASSGGFDFEGDRTATLPDQSLTPLTPAAPAEVITPADDDNAGETAAPPLRSSSGKRGGALAAVGLAVLGALALLAEGDRRMMRRAQRLEGSV